MPEQLLQRAAAMQVFALDSVPAVLAVPLYSRRARRNSDVLGGKLLLGDIVEFPNWVSLAVIAVSLALSLDASIIWPARTGQYSANTSSG